MSTVLGGMPVAARQSDSNEEEARQLLFEIQAAHMELEPLLQKLTEGVCPLYRIPAEQCQQCVERHPNHYPQGLTSDVQDILVTRYAPFTQFLQMLAQSSPGDRTR